MSSAHLSSDTLWEAARGEVVGDDYAHLQLCPDCREELDSIRVAQGLLVEPPPPPPVLSDASARRIGDVLRKAAEKQARTALWYGSWWPFNWNPMWTLAPLAAALLAFVAYRVTESIAPLRPGLTFAKKEPAHEPLTPTPPPMPEAPRPLPVKKVVAQVKRSKAAKSGSGAIKKAQELSEGSTVATAKGGELLMALPDGSQIALASASQVLLRKLEDKAITLDVDKGSLKVVAPHDPTRALRVRAGDLEVFDVGTEFIVSRDEGRTLVAVEEGEVEVKAPSGESVPLKAGQAVEWKGGKLQRQQWATADELPKPRPVVRPRPPLSAQVASAARRKPLAEETPDIPTEPQRATPPPAPDPAEEPQPKPASEPVAKAETASSPDEWTTPENLKDAPTHQPPPVPLPEAPPQAPSAVPVPPAVPEAAPQAPAPPSDDEAEVSFMSKIQSRLDKIKGVFKPPSRLLRANEISALADRRRCDQAVPQADAWLTEVVPQGESFNLRRSVLSSKLRCLNQLGRTGDAAAVQRELEKL